MKETVIYWVVIFGLCVLFPPLLGFVLGIGIFCAIWWFWLKVFGVEASHTPDQQQRRSRATKPSV